MREKIANRQLFYILFMMRTTVIIAFLPVLTTADVGQDAWLTSIITLFTTAAIAILVAALGTRFPEQTVIEYGEGLLGPWLGKIPSLVILLALLIIAASDVRIYCEMLVTSFLTETPLSFLIGTMILISALGAQQGIEVLARIADVIFPLFLIMLVSSLLLPLPEFRAAYLEPVFAQGLGPISRASVAPTAIGAQLLILTILIPNLTAPRLATRTALWATVASGLVLIIAAFIVVGVLGPDLGSRSVFPFYTMLRSIEISEFLQRVEAPIIFAWGLGVFVSVSVIIYAGARGFSQLLHLKDYRPLIMPMAVIQGAYSFQAYDDVFQLLALFRPLPVGPFTFSWFLLSLVPLYLGYLYRRLWPKKK
ncbi:MAG: endospore germination permease [Firmicutes bacterium]|nr:endospore germination permease [Bacillota bacterium]